MKQLVYILGGSGFIGKHLSEHLSECGFAVTVFDKYIDKAFFGARPQIRTVVHDCLRKQVSRRFKSPDFIINLASTLVTADRDLSHIGRLISDNIRIIRNIYDRFRDCDTLRLFVQFGSIEEYGPVEPPLCESQREMPNSAYSLMKQACTNYSMMLGCNCDFPVCVVRPGNLFGPGQNQARFISYVLRQLRSGETLDVTPCEQKRDFIYIDDFVALIGKILRHSNVFHNETVNVCSGSSIRLKDIIEKLREITGSKSAVNYGALPYRAGEVMDLRCSTEKLGWLLGEKLDINTPARLEEYAKI